MHAREPVSTLRADTGGCFTLELRGGFPPDWTGSFCARLGARRINVERGFARQVQRGEWESMFVIRPLDQGTDPLRLDFRALALARKERTLLQHPRIASFRIEDRGDALAVVVHAPDALGLLGRILGAFSLLMLFVHEMQIETAGSEARDSFVLKGLAGAAPGPIQKAKLREALQAMVEPPLAVPAALRVAEPASAPTMSG